MTRLSADPPPGPLYRTLAWFSRRRYGRVLQPLRAEGHHGGVLLGHGLIELAASRWRRLDTRLKDLAVFSAAARIGCAWCLDYGYWESHMHGVAREKIEAFPDWTAHADRFTECELLVITYADAMTATPPEVSDDLMARLRTRLTEPQITELTAIVALENLRSRMNAAYGMTGDGFKDRCDLPAVRGENEAEGS